MGHLALYSGLALLLVLCAHGASLRAAVRRQESLGDLVRFLAVAWLVVWAVMPARGLPPANMTATLMLDGFVAFVLYRATERFDLTYSAMGVWVMLGWLGSWCCPGAGLPR